MSLLGLILVIILVLFLLGGVAPWGNYPGPYHGYGFGGGGISLVGVVLIVVLVLVLLGRL
jgi:uncharacterized membrane protein